MVQMPQLSRRSLLKGAASVGAGLVLAFQMPAIARAHKPRMAGGAIVNGWLRISPDGWVTVFTNTSEIGQGTSSSIPQMIAEELEVEWKHIAIEMAPVEQAFFNPRWESYATYGSGGVAGQFDGLRKAGAAARMMLVQAAADAWGVPAAECVAKYGVVKHPPSERKAGFGELAAAASKLTPPADPPLKPRDQWTLIGKPVKRLDIPAKVDGSAVFGADVKLPGLLTATIAQAPAHGGRLVSVDEAPALAVKGVKRVVKLPGAVVVVANGWWPAKRGLDALSPVWDAGDNPQHSSADIARLLVDEVRRGDGAVIPRRDMTPEQVDAAHKEAMAKAAKTFEAVYEAPFEHHATMEPMNATARVGADGVEIWAPTQNQSANRSAVAEALGVAPEKVTIHTTLSGGGFGRRAESDFVVLAAQVAREIGAPVKLLWSREEDTTHGFYRPAAAARLVAGLDEKGGLVGLRVDAASNSILAYSYLAPDRPKPPFDFTGIMFLAGTGYSLPGYRLSLSAKEYGVRCGFWRSVGASQNAFFFESFLDELAVAAGIDPVDYRRALLKDRPRELGVLEAVVKASGWAKAPAKGVHRGVAMTRGNGTSTATVVDLSVTGREVRVHRVVTALDVGVAVNPDSVRAQTIGNVIWGLSAAMMGGLTVEKGAVQQRNFDDYPILTLAQSPEQEVVILETGEALGGAGEEAVASVAPAVANAIHRATGERLRRMPFKAAGFTLA